MEFLSRSSILYILLKIYPTKILILFLIESASTSLGKIVKSIRGKMKPKKNRQINPNCRIELGWMNFCSKQRQYKQVRSQSGGGIVPVPMLRTAMYDEVLHKARDVFFPEGKSSLGNSSNFNMHLSNYRAQPVGEDEFPLSQFVKIGTKTKIYLCTKQVPYYNLYDQKWVVWSRDTLVLKKVKNESIA